MRHLYIVNENQSFLAKDQPSEGVLWVKDLKEAMNFITAKEAVRKMEEVDPNNDIALGIHTTWTEKPQ